MLRNAVTTHPFLYALFELRVSGNLMMIKLSEIADQIRLGFRAEDMLMKELQPRLFQLATRKHKLTETEAVASVKRAVRAAVSMLRRAKKWDGDESVFGKLLDDQILVRKFNNNEVNDAVLKGLRLRLTKLQFYRHLPDHVLSDVISETFERFTTLIKQPSFKLTSRLVTFLNGIADRVAIETCKAYGSPYRIGKGRVSTFPYSGEYLNVFYEANQLIFEKLFDMDDVCHGLILSYYRIEPQQVMQTSNLSAGTPPDVSSYDELESLFNVSAPQHVERLTLEKVAENLGLNPKQIRKRHTVCLSKLYQKTASELSERVGEKLLTEVMADIRARKEYIKRRNKRQKI